MQERKKNKTKYFELDVHGKKDILNVADAISTADAGPREGLDFNRDSLYLILGFYWLLGPFA